MSEQTRQGSAHLHGKIEILEWASGTNLGHEAVHRLVEDGLLLKYGGDHEREISWATRFEQLYSI